MYTVLTFHYSALHEAFGSNGDRHHFAVQLCVLMACMIEWLGGDELVATNCLQQQRQWTLTRCVLDAKGKPPPPEKRDGAPVEGGCSKQSSNSLDWRGGVLGGLLDGYLCRHLQQEGGKVDSTISSYRGKAHELARQILKEGEPVCEHHVPHVSVEDQHMNSKPKRRFFECDGFV